jgi:hypothetical protein
MRGNAIKKLLAATILFSISFFVHGQMLIGVRSGYSTSTVNFLPSQKQQPLMDVVTDVGIVVKHFDLVYFGFQTEANFTQRGYRLPYNDTLFTKRINSYVELPMFMQIRTSRKNLFAHFNVGFYASYLLGAQVGNNEQGDYAMQNYRLSVLRDNRFDFGIPGGLGVGYNFGWGTIQADYRYFFGLADLYKHSFEGNPSWSPAATQNASISVLYNFSKQLQKSNELKKSKIKSK